VYVSQKRWCALFAGQLVKHHGELTAFVQVQQYADLNKLLLEAIVTMGSDSAVLSDAARSWLEIRAHYDNLSVVDLRRISNSPTSDLAQLRALASKRIDSGLTDGHYLALLLDPRPSMRKFVVRQGLLGSADHQTLGNSDELCKAQNALKHMSAAIHIEGRTEVEVYSGLCKTLLIYLEV
jgi:hypothetical protein